MHSTCRVLLDLIMNERIGIHEYKDFIQRAGIDSQLSDIIRDEAEHGLQLMELIPKLCSEEERALIEPDHLAEMEDYFKAVQGRQ